METRSVTAVLSGGIALGSYQAGFYDSVRRHPGLSIGWIAGSSIGAINGALIAGTPPGERLKALEGYWLTGTSSNVQAIAPLEAMRHTANWLNVLQARLFGSFGHIRAMPPRLSFASFYDLAPTVAYLRKTVDFGRLNSGETRFTVATVDVETGDAVLFDSGKGDVIEMDHILASCGFLPEFAPVEIAGRLLVDGGLALNAPVEPVLDELDGMGGVVFVVDLFAREGRRPAGLESSLARKNAILFGNQTFYRLEAYRRLWQKHAPGPLPTILYLSYLPVEGEAGAEMGFDFSRASANDRWQSGFLDAEKAIGVLTQPHGTSGTLTAIRRGSLSEVAAAAT